MTLPLSLVTPLLLGLALLPVVRILLRVQPDELLSGFQLLRVQILGRPWWRSLPRSVPLAVHVMARYGAAQLVVLTGWLVVLAFLAGVAWGRA